MEKSYNLFDLYDVHEELNKKELQIIKLEDLVFDLYLNDDAQAFKNAYRYLKTHRPDLLEKANEY